MKTIAIMLVLLVGSICPSQADDDPMIKVGKNFKDIVIFLRDWSHNTQAMIDRTHLLPSIANLRDEVDALYTDKAKLDDEVVRATAHQATPEKFNVDLALIHNRITALQKHVDSLRQRITEVRKDAGVTNDLLGPDGKPITEGKLDDLLNAALKRNSVLSNAVTDLDNVTDKSPQLKAKALKELRKDTMTARDIAKQMVTEINRFYDDVYQGKIYSRSLQ